MKMLLTVSSILMTLVLSHAASAKNAPLNCVIQTYNGRYLTAVGGGGRIDDAIHSDATQAKAWERFVLEDADKGTPTITYGIKTVKGYYLSAVSGGGQLYNVIHSDATLLRGWEEFQLEALGDGWFAIRTLNGNYLTAVGGGGRITDVIHSDAKRVGNWEKFKIRCRH